LALLELRNLRVSFKTEDGVVGAVNGLSYAVDRGATLGIVGESGSGKSVNALSVMRLIPTPPGRIESGSIRLRGEELLTKSEAQMRKIRGKEIAMIFQDPMTSLNPVLTIGRQIREALETHFDMDRGDAEKRAIELLDQVGIPGSPTRVRDYPHQFSGGMRQRAMIAMALACKPKLLIADEPTTALDVTIQAQILDLLRALVADTGMALILITHDLGVVAGHCERVNVMYGGMFMEAGSAAQPFSHPRHPYTLGLLQSVPRLDAGRRLRLHPIEGAPPNMLRAPTACPFQPRCAYEVDLSGREVPQLVEIEPGHKVACFNPVPIDEWDRARTAATA